MCVRAFVRPMNGNIKESRNRNIDDVSQKNGHNSVIATSGLIHYKIEALYREIFCLIDSLKLSHILTFRDQGRWGRCLVVCGLGVGIEGGGRGEEKKERERVRERERQNT